MNPYYTAQQLDFFKSALSILQTALLDAELMTLEQAQKQEVVLNQATETAVVDTDDADSSPKSSYFSVLPAPSEEPPSINPIAVVTPQANQPTCFTFFNALPWQKRNRSVEHLTEFVFADIAPAHSFADSVIEPIANIETKVISPLCIDFFSQLPWHVKPDSKHNQTISLEQVEVLEPQTRAELKNCISFFQCLPWQKAKTQVHQSVVKPTSNTCMVFFQHLPWHRSEKTQETDIDALMTLFASDDLTAISQFATHQALSTAERGAKESTPKTAALFFNSLPWA